MDNKSCKHKFRPRYSTKAPKYVAEMVKSMVPFKWNGDHEKIYECDVCERCGMVTKKPTDV